MKYLHFGFVYVLFIASMTMLTTGCISTITTVHEDYCTSYTEEERKAFRTLAGNTVSIDCKAYTND